MKELLRYLGAGLLIAGLEEFITQGVLKGSWAGWIAPTLVAFVPFLLLARFIGWAAERVLSKAGALAVWYAAAGAIGLLVEWFLIGLSPWRDAQANAAAIALFHFGMFSFWGTVGFAPRLFQDERPSLRKIRASGKRWLLGGGLCVYAITFASPPSLRFPACIVSVLVVFLGMNFFYVWCFRVLSRIQSPISPDPGGKK